ncbi:unnamed protein product, partial [Phaeothamnion confervicola]
SATLVGFALATVPAAVAGGLWSCSSDGWRLEARIPRDAKGRSEGSGNDSARNWADVADRGGDGSSKSDDDDGVELAAHDSLAVATGAAEDAENNARGTDCVDDGILSVAAAPWDARLPRIGGPCGSASSSGGHGCSTTGGVTDEDLSATVAIAAAAADPPPSSPGTAKAPAPMPGAMLLCLVLFFFVYVGAEVGFAAWVAVVALREGLAGEAQAAYVASGFWAAVTVGRLLSVPLSLWFSPTLFLFGGVGGSFVGSLALLMFGRVSSVRSGHRKQSALQESLAFLWICTVVYGLSMSALYPLAMNLPGSLGTALSPKATSALVISGACGEMFVPLLVGLLLE